MFVIALDSDQVTREFTELMPVKNILGKAFRQEAKVIMESLAKMDPETIAQVEEAFNNKGYVRLQPVISMA